MRCSTNATPKIFGYRACKQSKPIHEKLLLTSVCLHSTSGVQCSDVSHTLVVLKAHTLHKELLTRPRCY